MQDVEIASPCSYVHFHRWPSDFALVAPALSGRLSDSQHYNATTTPTANCVATYSASVTPAHHVVGRDHRGPETRQRRRARRAPEHEGRAQRCCRRNDQRVLEPQRWLVELTGKLQLVCISVLVIATLLGLILDSGSMESASNGVHGRGRS